MTVITECIAILAISLCLIVVLIRAGHADYAASVMPILVVPLLHLVALPLSLWLDTLLPQFPRAALIAFADIAAVVISCLMLAAFSGKIKSGKNKKLYIAMLGGYNIILTCALVHQTIAPLWR